MVELFSVRREVDKMGLMAVLAAVAVAVTLEAAVLALQAKEIMADQKLELALSGLAAVAQALLVIAIVALLVALVVLAQHRPHLAELMLAAAAAVGAADQVAVVALVAGATAHPALLRAVLSTQAAAVVDFLAAAVAAEMYLEAQALFLSVTQILIQQPRQQDRLRSYAQAATVFISLLAPEP